MRIPSIATLLVLPLVGAVTSASDDESSPWYLQLGGGISSLEDTSAAGGDMAFDNGYTLNALVGYDVFQSGNGLFNYSLELETYFSDTDVDRDHFGDLSSSTAEDTSTVAIMVNAVVDWEWSEKISMYGGAGIGQAVSIDFDTFGDSESDYDLQDTDALAVQGKVGLRYRLGGSASWMVGYRYFQTDDLLVTNDFIGGSFDMANRHHVFEFGVRWGN